MTSAEPLVRINPTRLRRFYRCEYEWFAYVVLGVNRLRSLDSEHRDRGKAFHALAEYAWRDYAETGVPFTFEGDVGQGVAREVLYALYKTEGTSLDEQASYEVLDAIRFQLERFDMGAWEVVRLADGTPLIEADLRAPLTPEVEMQAVVDLVLRHKATGKIWFIDFKTTAGPIDSTKIPPYIEHDDQLAMGREVLRANGIEVDFSALLHLRSLAPVPPHVVNVGKKNEGLCRSVDKLACDWETYRAALVERGDDPESEAALKVREGLRSKSFVRWQVDKSSPEGHAATLANIRRAAARMVALAKGDAKPIRRLLHVTRGACARCDYGTWCLAAMRNEGVDDLALLGTDYAAREGSPLAGRERYDAPLFNPADAYVQWAAAHGRTIEPHEEFRP